MLSHEPGHTRSELLRYFFIKCWISHTHLGLSVIQYKVHEQLNYTVTKLLLVVVMSVSVVSCQCIICAALLTSLAKCHIEHHTGLQSLMSCCLVMLTFHEPRALRSSTMLLQ